MKGWYREKFGWQTFKDSEEIVFFKLNGIILSLFPANELARDATIEQDGNGFKKFTLAICLNSEQEVNQTFISLKEKGVRFVKEPEKVFWGCYRLYCRP